MATTEQDIFAVLEVFDRLGASFGGQAVFLHAAKDGLRWEDDRFWDAVEEAQTRGLVENRRLYAILTLAGTKLVEQGPPTVQPPAQVQVNPTHLADLSNVPAQLAAFDDADFEAVEQMVAAERARRNA